MRNHIATALAAAVLLTACAPSAPQVEAQGAIVTLPAVPGHPGAGYFTLATNQDETHLKAVASPRAERIELHDTGMRPIADASFTSSEPLALTPGGRHAMIFGLDPSLAAGATIPLTFTFDNAPPVTVQADLRRPGDVRGGH